MHLLAGPRQWKWTIGFQGFDNSSRRFLKRMGCWRIHTCRFVAWRDKDRAELCRPVGLQYGRAGSPTAALLTGGAGSFSVYRLSCACRTCGNAPGLRYMLVAQHHTPCDNPMSPDIAKCRRETKSALAENHCCSDSSLEPLSIKHFWSGALERGWTSDQDQTRFSESSFRTSEKNKDGGKTKSIKTVKQSFFPKGQWHVHKT